MIFMRVSVFTLFSLLALAVTFFSFSTKKKEPVYRAPGVVQIDAHLFMDQTETTNFHWLEYLYWISKVYGDSSAEYMAALPDVSLWKNEAKHQDNEQFYLRHHAYRDYPVVGLNYRQMVEYCAWRSDRVFEYMLINEDFIPVDTNQTATHHFTINNYFGGKYGNYKTGSAHPPIPHYYLPREDEWIKAEAYSQAIYSKLTKRQLKHSPAVYYSKMNSNDATYPVMPTNKYSVKGALYNMHHNVSEQLSDSTQVAGENWKGSAALVEGENVFSHQKPSVTVGFRCAFMWK